MNRTGLSSDSPVFVCRDVKCEKAVMALNKESPDAKIYV